MLGLIGDVLVVVLLGCATMLCVVLTIAVIKLVPPLLRSARNLDKISTDLTAVSGDVAQDIAKAARNTSVASENAVEASANTVAATGDFAGAMTTLAAVSQLDIRAILTLVANGNIGNVKELAGFVAGNIPQAASRVGSMFRRGGG